MVSFQDNSFNRTNVELKLKWKLNAIFRLFGFNRTNVELKF